MNVLVTGGSGFVGREIVRRLRIAGHRISLLARHPGSPSVRQLAESFGASVVPGNVADPGSIGNACAGRDAVIHLVGIISEAGGQTFEKIHIGGTQNMVAAAQEAHVRRFIHMSALGARAEAPSRYHRSKWAAEERVRRSGLGWTIFRPSIIYGPEDSFVNRFAALARFSPFVPVPGDGKTRLQPVPVKSVADAFVKSLGEPRTIGEIYDLCGPDPLTLDEIIGGITAVKGIRRVPVHIPMRVMKAEALLLEWLFARLLRKAPPLNRDQLIMLQEDNVGDARPAERAFGLKPIPFREGISYLK